MTFRRYLLINMTIGAHHINLVSTYQEFKYLSVYAFTSFNVYDNAYLILISGFILVFISMLNMILGITLKYLDTVLKI